MTTILINRQWCKRCGICSEFCPGQVLTTDEFGLPSVQHLHKCTGCRMCMLLCPDFAIEVINHFTVHESPARK
ncbi:MAG: 2-ketoglutarate ferredoxin oxidoreductase subunit delta [Thermodesulfatator sp.]|nr:MAG: 2-ketoglutarate ferredoxin oxidoreductase subunit delta [Thermodesulfatator sp.]